MEVGLFIASMTLLFQSNYLTKDGGYIFADFLLSFLVSMLNFVFLTGIRRALLQRLYDDEHGLHTVDLFDLTRNHYVLTGKHL